MLQMFDAAKLVKRLLPISPCCLVWNKCLLMTEYPSEPGSFFDVIAVIFQIVTIKWLIRREFG